MGLKLPDTITVERPSGSDEYGNAGRGFDTVTTHTLSGFLIERAVTSTTSNESGISTRATKAATLILAPGADIERGDRVTCNGVVWFVNGYPIPARSPSAEKAVIVNLSDVVEGAP